MLDKIENLINALEANQSISVIENGILENRRLLKYRDAEENFEEVFDAAKIRVPKEDWKYEDLGSLCLDWDSSASEPDESYLWGGFRFHNFSSALESPSYFWKSWNDDTRFWKNNPQPEAEAIWKDFLPKLNHFHKSGHGDDGTFGCILREEGVYPCPVYFYDSGIWFRMNMTLKEYYNAMIACKAVYCWQYFYIDTQEIVTKLDSFNPRYLEHGAYYFKGPRGGGSLDEYRDGTITSSAQGVLLQMKNIIKRFPKLFPDVDLIYLKERCDALENALNL